MARLRKGILFAISIAALVIAHIHLRGNSTLYNFFFSPSDLYSNLAESTFNLTEKEISKEFKIVHKYPGNHWVAVLVEKPVNVGDHYDSNFKVKVSILNGSNV